MNGPYFEFLLPGLSGVMRTIRQTLFCVSSGGVENVYLIVHVDDVTF